MAGGHNDGSDLPGVPAEKKANDDTIESERKRQASELSTWVDQNFDAITARALQSRSEPYPIIIDEVRREARRRWDGLDNREAAALADISIAPYTRRLKKALPGYRTF